MLFAVLSGQNKKDFSDAYCFSQPNRIKLPQSQDFRFAAEQGWAVQRKMADSEAKGDPIGQSR
jgi:hypothetical protein